MSKQAFGPEELHRRRLERMAFVDQLPQAWRDLVNEYGLNVVLRLWKDGHSVTMAAAHLPAIMHPPVVRRPRLPGRRKSL